MKYEIALVSGRKEKISADQVTYDDAGNLMFLNIKQGIQTPANPSGQSIELVKCYNARHYESYCHDTAAANVEFQH